MCNNDMGIITTTPTTTTTTTPKGETFIILIIFRPYWSFLENTSLYVFEYYICLLSICQGVGLECYYCGHEDEYCNTDNHGEPVNCQMEDPEGHNYGDSCYVGHSGC